MDLLSPLPADLFGYLAAALVFATFAMKTMPTLRVIAVISNAVFIAYGLMAELMPVLVLHAALLPLNLARLAGMRRALREAEATTREGEAGYGWLIPFAKSRRLPAGALLFARGEKAESLYVLTRGEVELPEVGVTLRPGDLFGEVALFSDDRTRTASAIARTDIEVAELSEERVQQLYFDNPRFAYRLIRTVTGRLVENVKALEQGVAARGATDAPRAQVAA